MIAQLYGIDSEAVDFRRGELRGILIFVGEAAASRGPKSGRNRDAYLAGNPRRGAPATSHAGSQWIRKLPLQLAFDGVGIWVMAGALVGHP